MGVKESDTGLAPANLWDTMADKQRQGEHPLQVARCQTIIRAGELNRSTPDPLSCPLTSQPTLKPRTSRSTPRTVPVPVTPTVTAMSFPSSRLPSLLLVLATVSRLPMLRKACVLGGFMVRLMEANQTVSTGQTTRSSSPCRPRLTRRSP